MKLTDALKELEAAFPGCHCFVHVEAVSGKQIQWTVYASDGKQHEIAGGNSDLQSGIHKLKMQFGMIPSEDVEIDELSEVKSPVEAEAEHGTV